MTEIDEFLREWHVHLAEGKTMRLPAWWRFKVHVMSLAGATQTDWRYALGKAMHAAKQSYRPIQGDAVFDEAVSLLWQHLGARSGYDPSEEAPYVLDADAARAAVRKEELKKQEDAKYRARGDELLAWANRQGPFTRSSRWDGVVHRQGGCARADLQPLFAGPIERAWGLCKTCFQIDPGMFIVGAIKQLPGTLPRPSNSRSLHDPYRLQLKAGDRGTPLR